MAGGGSTRAGPEGRRGPAGRGLAVSPLAASPPPASSPAALVRARGLQDLSGDGGVRKMELRPGRGQPVPPGASVAGTAGRAAPGVPLFPWGSSWSCPGSPTSPGPVGSSEPGIMPRAQLWGLELRTGTFCPVWWGQARGPRQELPPEQLALSMAVVTFNL